MNYFVDIKTNYRVRQKHPFRAYFRYNVTQNSQNIYSVECCKNEINKIKRIARRNHYNVLHVYPETSARSENYRYVFFRTHKRPVDGHYRCIYCNKKLNDKDLQVDHIYPIRMAKTKVGQRYLKRHGLESVNDPKNLVASCKYCNKKKGTKTGLWLLRAKLGKYQWYWVAQQAIICGLVAAVSVGIVLFFVSTY